jgi:hypothetical protein
MRPFAIENPSQFRADGPPALDSEQYAADFNETKKFGSLNSAYRTPEQTELARFFLDVAAYQSARGLRRLALEKRSEHGR